MLKAGILFYCYTMGRSNASHGEDWRSLMQDNARRDAYVKGYEDYMQGMRE